MTQSFNGLDFVKTLPQAPGVYKMYAGGDLLYVGKAKDLSKRVGSYFNKTLDVRLSSMVRQITHIDTVVVPTEIDALVLESQLIKQENPKYNIQLKDDKGFPYIVVETDKETPTLSVAFKKPKKGRAFGPFPSRQSVYQALEILKTHFKLRTCSDSFFKNRTRPCLEYQLGRCSAPCVQKISKEDYQISVKELCLVLEGKSNVVIDGLIEKMNQASDNMDYEKASVLRDRITSLRHVQSKVTVEAGSKDEDVISLAMSSSLSVAFVLSVRVGKIISTKTYRFSTPPDSSESEVVSDFLARYLTQKETMSPYPLIVDVPDEELSGLNALLFPVFNTKCKAPSSKTEKDMMGIAKKSAQQALQSMLSSSQLRFRQLQDLASLLDLEEVPHRVECFDVSHTQGQDTIASKVVLNAQGPIKSLYRRYTLEGTNGNDLLAMEQALERRFSKKEALPDVLLIDGGITQLAKAMEVLKKHNLENIPCIGVAKGVARIEGEETLIVGQTGQEFKPGARSEALRFVQAVRNEAHRFAIEGHRKKREKRMVRSILEEVEGLGPQKRKSLLEHFGGLSGIKKASLEDISRVKGVGLVLGKRLYDILHDQ